MAADKDQSGSKSWWPRIKKSSPMTDIPAIPQLEWQDINEVIKAAEKAILQVSNGLRLQRRKTIEYLQDNHIVETVKEIDSSEIVRTEYTRSRTVKSRQVYGETSPPPPVPGHPHHVEKHEDYVNEDGSEQQSLINIYSSGKGTAFNMAGGYTGKSARLADGSKIQMWYDDENRLFEIRYLDEKGQYHRLDGPAHLKFDHDREQARVFFYQHGMLHNEEGAAIQEFSQQQLAISEYYLHGQKFASASDWHQAKDKFVK